MINFIKYFLQIINITCVISKNQMLTHSGSYKLPKFIKVIGYIINIKGLFIKPKDSFGKRLADCFYNLGPVYIKLGQTLSTRPDLVGIEVAENLKYLQDKLPPFDKKIVHELVQTQLKRNISELFLNFDEKPMAAASVAQVHKAQLKTGELVAVKLLRPETKKKYQQDILFLEFMANLLPYVIKKAKRLKPKEVISVFKTSMNSELNLRFEAAAASRLYDNFINDDSLLIPKIHWSFTTNDILTLEWIDGISIYDKEAIKKFKLDPVELARKFIFIFCNQAYRDGFFHADLHPGNILVCPDGRIALLDFGIIGILPKNDRLAIAEILYAFLKKDYSSVAEIHHRVKYIPQDTNIDQFAMSCRSVAEPMLSEKISNLSIGNLLAQLFKITEEYGMEIQPQLILLQKTMVVVEGISKNLSPDVNMLQLAEPWIKKWAAKNISPEAKLLRFFKEKLIQLGNHL